MKVIDKCIYIYIFYSDVGRILPEDRGHTHTPNPLGLSGGRRGTESKIDGEEKDKKC